MNQARSDTAPPSATRKTGRLIAGLSILLVLFLATLFTILAGLMAWLILLAFTVAWALRSKASRKWVNIGQTIGIVASVSLGLMIITLPPIGLVWLYARYLLKDHQNWGTGCLQQGCH
ncbi:hypothetical protein ACTSKR_01635 [Chitinibacteraceae bacterium HSL-7]